MGVRFPRTPLPKLPFQFHYRNRFEGACWNKINMSLYRNIQRDHELAVLGAFSNYLAKLGKSLKVIERPDPPDAIVEVSGVRSWLEITDAFFDDAHAKLVNLNAATDKANISYGRRIVEPDISFKKNLYEVIEKKYKKRSMLNEFSKSGPGILVVGINTPHSSAVEVLNEEKQSIAKLIRKQKSKIFNEIYLYEPYEQIGCYKIYP